jgi:hypothetical protein
MSEGESRVVGRLFDASGGGREVPVRHGMAMPADDQLLWIDVGRDEHDLRALGEALGWGDELLTLTESASRPRVVKAKDWTRIAVVALERRPMS